MEQINACKRLFAAKFLLHLSDYISSKKNENRIVIDPLTRKKRKKGMTPDGNEALRWIDSQDASPSSFIWCCQLFDIDPDRTRRKILIGWRSIRRKSNGKQLINMMDLEVSD